MKRTIVVLGLILAVIIPGAHAVSARQQRPTPTVSYVVRSGDTLWRIAGASLPGDRRKGVYRIMELNHLESALVFPGQTIRLPQR